MAYDLVLADRIRKMLSSEAGITEKKMFGGLAFLTNGHMTIAASGQGGLLVRVEPALSESLLAETTAELMVMRGQSMPGWLRVRSSDVSRDDELARWVGLSSRYARSLPAKR